mgnify:CR=1 FL=1
MIQEFNERVVVFADDFGKDVKRACAEDNVVDLGHLGEAVGHDSGITRDPDPEHRLATKAEAHRVSDRNDLHHTRLGELLHALTHGRLTETNRLANFSVRTTAIKLQLLDDRLRGRVKRDVGSFGAHTTDLDTSAAKTQRNSQRRDTFPVDFRSCLVFGRTISSRLVRMRVLQNFINGDFVPSESDQSFDVINPVTEEIIATGPVSSAAEVDRAYRAAQSAFLGEWGATTPQQRSLALHKIAAEMERRADDFADAESLDCGKPRHSIIADEIMQSVDQLRFFAGAARNLEGKGATEYLAGHTSYVRREPIGVVGQVTPWNYPLNMAVWKIGPALAAGNTVVLKPASVTPLSTLLLAEITQGILPPGVFNVVLGDRVTGQALTEHPVPELVAITGSVRAGMEVAHSAIDGMKRTHLELGGKAPAVVFADADIAKTAEAIATAAFFNAGQDCTAATRLIVQAGVHDELVSELKRFVETTVTVGPDVVEPFYGPMNNDRQFASVLGVIERLPAHATMVTGGTRIGESGYFIAPTIVTGMRQDDEAVQEEIFGPVLTVQTFETEAEALELANGVRYALAASVFTKDHGTAMRLTKRLDFGCVWVNTHIPFVSEMPHGGFKYSGYGKDLSMYGFEDYTRIKHVMHFLDE